MAFSVGGPALGAVQELNELSGECLRRVLASSPACVLIPSTLKCSRPEQVKAPGISGGCRVFASELQATHDRCHLLSTSIATSPDRPDR